MSWPAGVPAWIGDDCLVVTAQPRLTIVPCTIRDANEFVLQHHRHHRPTVGGLFALAVSDGAAVRGVAIVGRPSARLLNDGYTAEVTRVATDGCANACSALYGGAWRASRALGWRRLVTYTLPEEGGCITARCRVAQRRRVRRRNVGQNSAAESGQASDAEEIPLGGN